MNFKKAQDREAAEKDLRDGIFEAKDRLTLYMTGHAQEIGQNGLIYLSRVSQGLMETFSSPILLSALQKGHEFVKQMANKAENIHSEDREQDAKTNEARVFWGGELSFWKNLYAQYRGVFPALAADLIQSFIKYADMLDDQGYHEEASLIDNLLSQFQQEE